MYIGYERTLIFKRGNKFFFKQTEQTEQTDQCLESTGQNSTVVHTSDRQSEMQNLNFLEVRFFFTDGH